MLLKVNIKVIVINKIHISQLSDNLLLKVTIKVREVAR